jgi:hypothetical protein
MNKPPTRRRPTRTIVAPPARQLDHPQGGCASQPGRFFFMHAEINLARLQNTGDQSANRTRQGYARKRILKPAGHLFSGQGMEVGPL